MDYFVEFLSAFFSMFLMTLLIAFIAFTAVMPILVAARYLGWF